MANLYYWLSPNFSAVQHGPLAVALSLVIGGGEGYFRSGNVMDHMTRLIRSGVCFDSQQYTEVGRWGGRSEDVVSTLPIGEDAFFAWADPDFWDFSPPLTVYTKLEFMVLFEDCCRNFVNANPARSEEFSQALLANGMSL